MVDKLKAFKRKYFRIRDYVCRENRDNLEAFEAEYIQKTFLNYGMTKYSVNENGEFVRCNSLKWRRLLFLLVIE